MNRTLSLMLLCLLAALILTSCGKKQYPFKLPTDEIEIIEIVSAEDALNFTVVKTLSESEQIDFLDEFENIRFNRYYFGDPMSVHGDSIKITYQNGDYEMICSSWADCVIDGKTFFVWVNCDENIFNDLINKFLTVEAEN